MDTAHPIFKARCIESSCLILLLIPFSFSLSAKSNKGQTGRTVSLSSKTDGAPLKIQYEINRSVGEPYCSSSKGWKECSASVDNTRGGGEERRNFLLLLSLFLNMAHFVCLVQPFSLSARPFNTNQCNQAEKRRLVSQTLFRYERTSMKQKKKQAP